MAPGKTVWDSDLSDRSDGSETGQSTARWPLMTGPMVWEGSGLDESQYVYHLTPGDVAEIEIAVEGFKDLGQDGPDISRENFELPLLGDKLSALAEEVHVGKGFFVLSGWDPTRYSVEDNAMIFLGLSAYVGEDRGMQDNEGNMLVHLRDEGQFQITKASNKESHFHSENFCDILALFVRENAMEGGGIHISSSWKIYNDLRTSRPDILEELAKPNWDIESRGKLFPACKRPLLFLHEEKVILSFSRRPLIGRGATDFEDPNSRLTPTQTEAIRHVHKIAQRHRISLNMKKGDMIFLNNRALLHARDSFRDSDGLSRHLIRLWLKNQRLAWRLPPQLQKGNENIYYEDGITERWPLEGRHEYELVTVPGDSPSPPGVTSH